MIRTIGPTSKECVTKLILKLKLPKKVFCNNKFIENNGDPRKTWQTINDLTSRKVVHSSIREINLKGTFISESSDLSNAFNDHFSSIGSKLGNDIPLSNDNDHCQAQFIRRISAVSNAIQTIDNEANHLIIYCLNCIRHGRNATYEPGLIENMSKALTIDSNSTLLIVDRF